MEIYKRDFQLKLEKLKEKLWLVKSRLEIFEEKLGLFKALKIIKDELVAKNISIAKKVSTINKNKMERKKEIIQAQNKKNSSNIVI